MNEIENFDEVATRAEALYRSIEPVRCPYLDEVVHFNAHGLEHLKFKRRGKARSRHDQYMRFKLLHLVPEVLRLSRTLQGVWETKHFERVRVHSRTETTLQQVTFFEFIAIMEKKRVKVIVKQIENGERFFWSIIPFWGVDKERGQRKLYAGNPAED
ncbi:hypothetical protein HZC00_03175 [Candidatus Kaiserbacteria bacterium]|nr:hypothetical protein [Candidatus Kaiserbacteria bacterium]